MPQDLTFAYTRCGAYTTREFYIDDSKSGKGTHYKHSRSDIQRRIEGSKKELAHPNPMVGAGGRKSWAYLLQALNTPLVKSAVQGGRVVVFGSTQPTVEAMLLAAGAAFVMTVEYNQLTYDHPSVLTVTPEAVNQMWASSNSTSTTATTPTIPPPHSFDLAVSMSSFDHDGLGRYGDPLAPDGDLLAMDHMAAFLKHKEAKGGSRGGIALVSVPLGPDRVWWNLMRVYGKVRLPLLLEGWEVLDRVGWKGGKELEEGEGEKKGGGGSPGVSHEPVFVLRVGGGEGGEGEGQSKEVEQGKEL